MSTIQRAIQYYALLKSPGASNGPGAVRYDLTPDLLNLHWQRSLNLAGAATFTLVRNSSKVSDIAPHQDHVEIWREATGVPAALIWQGKVASRDIVAGDTVIRCLDYLSYLQRSRSGWKTLYPGKKIGTEIVSPEWALAKGAANSPLAFVANGTFEDPLALDGITAVKTNSKFGLMMFDRLFVFYSLASMAMVNTSNNVVFEITVSATPTFNFWKNRSVDRSSSFALTFPGNLRAFNYQPGELQVTNDVASVIKSPTGGTQVYQIEDAGSITSYSRLQQAVTIQTLMGLTSTATEADQQKEAVQRILKESIRLPKTFIALPRQGEVNPFNGWDLGDNFKTLIQKTGAGASTDEIYQYMRLVSIAGAWTPQAGEQLQLYLRAKD